MSGRSVRQGVFPWRREFGGDVHDVANKPLPFIHHFNKAGDLPTSCHELFQLAERDSFDLSADWFHLLSDTALLEGQASRFYLLEQENETRVMLPLLLQGAGNKSEYTVTGLSNFYSSLFRPLLARDACALDIVQVLRQVIKDTRSGRIRFNAMDPSHPSFALMVDALRQAGFRSYSFFGFGNWYLPVQGRSFEEYFQGLASQVRNTVRRREKKFLADGRGQLKIVTGQDGLEEGIAAWDKIYRSSWKTEEPFPEFVPGLIRMCAARGWLRLGIAYYDGEAVAAQLWIVSHGRAAIYKLAYDEKFAKLSAGTVLTAHLMRHALDADHVQEVDYLIGDDGYKKDWMNHRRERWGIVAFNLRTLSGILGAFTESGRRMGKRAIIGWRSMLNSVGTKRPQDSVVARGDK